MFVSVRGVLLNLARGAALGVVELVPGVSAGTLALVLGIYRQLIEAVAAVVELLRVGLVRFVPARRPRTAASAPPGMVPWTFLAAVVCGMAVAIVTFSHVISTLLERHPGRLLAFFFGAVLVSSLLPLLAVRRWRGLEIVALVVAAAATFVLLGLAPGTAAGKPSLWYLLVSGGIAASVMILPGISGSFVLLLLGPYPYVVSLVRQLPQASAWLPLLIFASGAAVGLATVASGLRRLLQRAPGPTYAALAGLMLGSLRRLWPFLAPGSADAPHTSNLASAEKLSIDSLGALPDGAMMPIVTAALGGTVLAALGVAAARRYLRRSAA